MHRLRRQRDDGRLCCSGTLAQPPERGHAVDSRELDVQQDEIRVVLNGELDGLFPARRFEDAVAPRIQHVTNELHVDLVVLDYEDAAPSIYDDSRGRLKRKVLPLAGSLSTQMRPPCNSISLRESASPRPVPSGRSPSTTRPCRNSSKISS